MKTISIIGGDLRQAILADMLTKSGFDATVFGFDKCCEVDKLKTADNLKSAASCDAVILPLPVSYDNSSVNAPFSSMEIKLGDIFEHIGRESILLGGRVSEYIRGELDSRGIIYRDYFEREELTVQNAVPTAEGAVELALSEMPITLHDCNALILGYGRIGKVLASILDGFNANISVCARRYETLSWIHTMGYKALPICSLSESIGKYDVIFNTVPSVLLDKQVLRNVNGKSLIIDLASKPGGVDFETAQKLGLHVIWALSLPGKVAPITSGKIIKDTIVNILTEMGWCDGFE